MPPCIAALDVGTTSVKACLFTPELELIACCVQEYALDTRGAWVEARPETYLAAARDAMCAALAAAPGHRPEALGLCTQGETMVPADAQGQALRPFLVWLDSRAGTQAAVLEKILGRQRFYETTGLPQLSGATPLAKAMWLRENGGLRGAERLLLLEDYLLGWLTGRAVTEPAVQTSTGWYDIRHDRYWPEALEAAGISVRLLPACVPCGEKAGPLQREAAALLGLPEGIPVAAGAMDQTATALAAGAAEPGAVTETTGTALVMAACTKHPAFPREGRVTVYRHALPGRYLYLPIGNTAGMALRWFRDVCCPDLPAGGAGYAALDREAAAVPLGCEGVTFLPFLAGAPDQDECPGARGAFYGARLSTTRAHLARSVMESAAFMIRDFLSDLERLGCPAREVRSLGGGARSAVWLQMKADICGRVFRVPACTEAAAQGAALLAGWGSGLIARGEVPPPREAAAYAPDPALAVRAEAAHGRYRRLYAALKPLFSDEVLD